MESRLPAAAGVDVEATEDDAVDDVVVAALPLVVTVTVPLAQPAKDARDRKRMQRP